MQARQQKRQVREHPALTSPPPPAELVMVKRHHSLEDIREGIKQLIAKFPSASPEIELSSCRSDRMLSHASDKRTVQALAEYNIFYESELFTQFIRGKKAVFPWVQEPVLDNRVACDECQAGVEAGFAGVWIGSRTGSWMWSEKGSGHCFEHKGHRDGDEWKIFFFCERCDHAHYIRRCKEWFCIWCHDRALVQPDRFGCYPDVFCCSGYQDKAMKDLREVGKDLENILFLQGL